MSNYTLSEDEFYVIRNFLVALEIAYNGNFDLRRNNINQMLEALKIVRSYEIKGGCEYVQEKS